MLSKIWNGIINALFPPDITCICCNAELRNYEERRFGVCAVCDKELDNISYKKQEIANPNLFFTEFYTVFNYSGAAKKLIVGFKDGNKPYLGEYMARFMYDAFREKSIADCIVYVPASSKKAALRGYDHMKLVAEKFAKLSGIPLFSALKRIKQSEDQTESDDRYANIKGQFVLQEAVCGSRVLLLDDVVTTGATASECAKTLIEGGAKAVVLLTFAEAASFGQYKSYAVKRMQERK